MPDRKKPSGKPIPPAEVMNLVSKYERKSSGDQGSLQKEIKLLYSLLDAVRTLNESRQLDKLLANVITQAVEVCNAERGFIYFKSADIEKVVARGELGIEWDPSKDGYSQSVLEQVLSTGRRLVLDEDEDALTERNSVFELSLRSIACFPLTRNDQVCGALYIHSKKGSSFGAAELRTLGALSDIATSLIITTQIIDENNTARKEITELNARLREQISLQEEELHRTKEALARQSSMFQKPGRYGGMIGISNEICRVTELLRSLEDTELPVLISGESGTGKELAARAIHSNSSRSSGPFLAINCGALPDSLLSAELFGFKKGAFTGATSDRRGLFELASGGTLFLDEVVSMSTDMQKSLLRVLERGEVLPLGSEKTRNVDVRVVAAANRDINELVSEGSFREDLFYRLAVVTVSLPPLRVRTDDIPLLIEHFCQKHGNPKGVSFSQEALVKLQSFGWPGNVRQLENEIRRSLALGRGELSSDFFAHLTGALAEQEKSEPHTIVLSELEEWAIRRALELSGGQKVKAAELLGIPRRTLYEKLKKLQL